MKGDLGLDCENVEKTKKVKKKKRVRIKKKPQEMNPKRI